MKKDIIKRALSGSIAVLVFASSLVCPSFAAENQNGDFLLCEAYNSYATYQTPFDGTDFRELLLIYTPKEVIRHSAFPWMEKTEAATVHPMHLNPML